MTAASARKKSFGPVGVIQKFKTLDEVIDLANASEYGLGGTVFHKEHRYGPQVARSVRTQDGCGSNTYNDLLTRRRTLWRLQNPRWPGNPQESSWRH